MNKKRMSAEGLIKINVLNCFTVKLSWSVKLFQSLGAAGRKALIPRRLQSCMSQLAY